MPSFFKSPKAPSPEVIDIRSPAEKEAADLYAGLSGGRSRYFSNLMSQPDLGYQSQDAALDPIYNRMRSRYAENVEQSAAERGFEPLRYGPAVSEIARGNQEMGENRAADEIARKQWWQQYVTSGGVGGGPPVGRSVYQGPTPGPSPFASLLSPVLGGIGYGLGGPLGGIAGGMLGSAATPYGGSRSPYGNQPLGYGSNSSPYVMG